MVRITRVYTKKGDRGTTGAKGHRVSKTSLRVEALGLLDELNSFLGWVIVSLEEKFIIQKEQLLKIQNQLFELGAYLCTDKKNPLAKEFFTTAVSELELQIDDMNSHLTSLHSFILPGGNEISARLHIARTVCRRTECKLVALAKEQKDNAGLPFINRLSDWLFVAARFINKTLDNPEPLWIRCLETN